MTTSDRTNPRRPLQYTHATAPRPAPRREAAAVIADLLHRRIAPTRSREEQAFIEGQHGSQQ